MQQFAPTVSIVVGVALLFARRRFARSIIAGQNAFWNSRFGDKEIRMSEFIVMIGGIFCVVLGALALFGAFR
jgi:hypothetical protein